MQWRGSSLDVVLVDVEAGEEAHDIAPHGGLAQACEP